MSQDNIPSKDGVQKADAYCWHAAWGGESKGWVSVPGNWIKYEDYMVLWDAYQALRRLPSETPEQRPICDCSANWKGCQAQSGRTCAVGHYHRDYTPSEKASESPEQRRAATDAAALADAHRMYEATYGEPFRENESAQNLRRRKPNPR